MYQERSIIPAATRFIWPNDKPPFGVRLNRRHPLARGLVGAWVMNESAGNRLIDLSGNENGGVVSGANWASNGLDFDGITDYVQIENSSSMDLTAGFSLVAKFEPHSVSGYHMIVTKTVGAGGTSNYELRLSNTQIQFYAGATGVSAYGVTNNTDNTLSCTWDETTAKVYHDGVFLGSSTSFNPSSVTNRVLIGMRDDNFGEFEGIYKYVYIYNRALRPPEISFLNWDPYQMFTPVINPAMMYYTTPSGVSIPVFNHLYNQMRA